MRHATRSGRVGTGRARSAGGWPAGAPGAPAGTVPAGWAGRAALAVALLGAMGTFVAVPAAAVTAANGVAAHEAVADGAMADGALVADGALLADGALVADGAASYGAASDGAASYGAVSDGAASGGARTLDGRTVPDGGRVPDVAVALQKTAMAGAPSFAAPGAELVAGGGPVPYGAAVAISGDTAAVSGLGANQRAGVYVFVRVGEGWVEQARIADPAGADAASLFGHALALSGDTLAVGDGAEGAAVSSVYIYTRTAGSWSLQAHLQPPAAAGLGFGAALALAGDTLVAGVPGAGNGMAAGAAWVYARSGDSWRRAAIVACGIFGLSENRKSSRRLICGNLASINRRFSRRSARSVISASSSAA